MKFKIDKRYIVIQSLLAIVGYILGVFIVLNFLVLKYPTDFIVTSLFAGITLYFLFFYPRIILIKGGIVSFVERNRFERTKVNVADITKVIRSGIFYNTVVIITKKGKKYKLHPKEAQELENVIHSHK